jgi:3-hydroxyisobutyrate dehydrogenase-like beta-hydroxyacid dehydrogenase
MATERKASHVSVLGLGNMGAALARAFLAHGRTVTVWNRTPTKAEALAKAGAIAASSAAEAIAASPVTVVCAIDKAASGSFMRSAEVAVSVNGRTIVDVSTGSATDARIAAELLRAAGAKYIDGGILCYPRDIGKTDTVILYSGNAEGFQQHRNTLAILAGAQRHLGEEPGAAATVYLALWSFYFGGLTAYFEGAALAATASVRVDQFAAIAAIMTRKLAEGIDDATQRIVTQNLAGDQAPIDAYLENLYVVRDAFVAARVDHLSVDAFIAHLENTRTAGGGGKDVAALFETIFAAGQTR